jgi:hypothetical protein
MHTTKSSLCDLLLLSHTRIKFSNMTINETSTFPVGGVLILGTDAIKTIT